MTATDFRYVVMPLALEKADKAIVFDAA